MGRPTNGLRATIGVELGLCQTLPLPGQSSPRTATSAKPAAAKWAMILPNPPLGEKCNCELNFACVILSLVPLGQPHDGGSPVTEPSASAASRQDACLRTDRADEGYLDEPIIIDNTSPCTRMEPSCRAGRMS